ncbi:HAD-IA family hydrolase [Staphylococcus simulans]|uniref:HAD family hydrolase n=1 Tax=Staphylococcus simulans TaxID=1286 RepID=UPI001E59057D|nr:HAD-IA family hydrolase [Staphylococcus simulans]MCD8915714.1 HAD-IA family hydrolase [Staphylococcus simulans]
MKYRAVVFDFDGTIIDTEQHLYDVINEHLSTYQKAPISLDFYRQSIGGAALDLHHYLEDEIGEDATLKLYEDHHQKSKTLPMIENIRKLMDKLEKAQIPMAIATSSSINNIRPALEHLNLVERVPVIVGREDVEEVKPAPDLYLTAVQQLNLNPVSCLAIEDSVNGATAAQLAGLGVIVNTNVMTEAMDFSTLDLEAMNISADTIIERYFKS